MGLSFKEVGRQLTGWRSETNRDVNRRGHAEIRLFPDALEITEKDRELVHDDPEAAIRLLFACIRNLEIGRENAFTLPRDIALARIILTDSRHFNSMPEIRTLRKELQESISSAISDNDLKQNYNKIYREIRAEDVNRYINLLVENLRDVSKYEENDLSTLIEKGKKQSMKAWSLLDQGFNIDRVVLISLDTRIEFIEQLNGEPEFTDEQRVFQKIRYDIDNGVHTGQVFNETGKPEPPLTYTQEELNQEPVKEAPPKKGFFAKLKSGFAKQRKRWGF